MKEPSIIDYYTNYPEIISVIDKLNKEADDLRKINEELKQSILDITKKYNKELKEYKKINELKLLLLEIAYEKKSNKKKTFGCF